MSTSRLCHAFGIRGYDSVHAAAVGGAPFTIRQRRPTCRCSACGSRDGHPHASQPRALPAVPIGGKPVRVALAIPRVGCPRCGLTRQGPLSFADPRRGYPRSFERYARALSRLMTIRDVATPLQVGWDVRKDIRQRDLRRRCRKPRLGEPSQGAVDESAIRRGHRCLTVGLNLQTGAVAFVGDGQGADALGPFWKRLHAARATIEALATDMPAASIGAVRARLGEAARVFAHCHVRKRFNEQLSDGRREPHRQATEQRPKGVREGARWLLLKDPESLGPRRKGRERRGEALRMGQPLATAYSLKADMRPAWGQPDEAAARRVLGDGVRRAEASGIQVLPKLGGTPAMYRTGILAYYAHRVSTGPLEGATTKVRTVRRQAYGSRDQEFFRLKIDALHEAKYAFVG